MNVADAMTPRESLVTAEIPGTREDALDHLQELSFSSVPVIKQTDGGEQFRGLVSRETLIEHPDEDQLALLVEEVPTITADASLEELASLMRTEDARRVPVVDGKLRGIVTVTDVVRAVAEGKIDGSAGVADLATRELNCVYAETPLPVAERELAFADVPYGVVLGDVDDEGEWGVELAGILTEVDILEVAEVVEGEDDTGESIANQDDEWMWEGIKAVGNRYFPTRRVEIPAEPVRKFMTADVLTVSQRKTATDAAQLMIQHEIEQIPMLRGDELVGIVRDVDLLEAL